MKTNMQLNSVDNLDSHFEKVFKDTSLGTLFGSGLERDRFHIENFESNEIRIAFANMFLTTSLQGKFWIRLSLYNNLDKNLKELISAGFDVKFHEDAFQKAIEEGTVIWKEFDRYSIQIFKPLLESHLNFEIGLSPAINAICYFVNFDDGIVINIYDDRGMDIVFNDAGSKLKFYELMENELTLNPEFNPIDNFRGV